MLFVWDYQDKQKEEEIKSSTRPISECPTFNSTYWYNHGDGITFQDDLDEQFDKEFAKVMECFVEISIWNKTSERIPKAKK